MSLTIHDCGHIGCISGINIIQTLKISDEMCVNTNI